MPTKKNGDAKFHCLTRIRLNIYLLLILLLTFFSDYLFIVSESISFLLKKMQSSLTFRDRYYSQSLWKIFIEL